MSTLNRRISLRPIGAILALAFFLATWGEAAADFQLLTQATVTQTNANPPLSVTLTVKGKNGSPVLFNPATNELLVRGNSGFDVSLTYSPMPGGYDPSSTLDNKGIFSTIQLGPFSGGQIGTATASYTQNGPTRVIYGDVKYTLKSTPTTYWGYIELVPYLTVVDAAVVVQTQNEDGTVQANPNFTSPGTADTLLPGGTEIASIAFDMHIYTTDKTHRGSVTDFAQFIPAKSVQARVIYQGRWDTKLVYALPWATTDASGHARTTIGSGRDTIPINGFYNAKTMYLNVVVGFSDPAPAYLPKLLILNDMQTFNGTLNVTVTDPDDHPLGAYLTYWGGMSYLAGGSSQSTDAKGIAAIKFGTGTDQKDLGVALNPQVTVTQYQTQVIDFPGRWVNQYTAYLSPQIDLAKLATTYKTDKKGASDLIVRVKDSKGNVVGEYTTQPVKHPDAWTPTEILKGNNRIYFPYTPPASSDYYTVEAVFENNEPEADEDEQVVGAANFPVLLTSAPALDRPFNFQFVAVSANAPLTPPGTCLLTSRISTAQITKLMKWVERVFPAPIIYSTGPDQVASSWYMDSGRVKYYFYYLTQYKPHDVDLVVGVVAPGDLNTLLGGTAAGLSVPNYPFVVLIDPSKITDVGILHEFLHTRGLPDNYTSGVSLAAEDGYDTERRQPMINLMASKSFPQVQAVMFDGANDPWLSQTEYGRLLDYATVPIAHGKPRAAATLQKVMIVSGRFQWSAAPFSGLTLVSNEPVFTDYDVAYTNQPSAKWDYLMPGVHLANAAETIVQDSWVLPMGALEQPKGVYFDPYDAGAFTFKIPYRDEYTRLYYAGFNWRKQIAQYNKMLTFSANAPTAAWVSPASGASLAGNATLSYTASDKDGDPLYAWVKVSTDGGQSWRAASPYRQIAAGTNTFTLDCTQYPSTTQCKIKVLVSDGLRSTILEPANVYKLTGYAADPKILAEPAAYAASVKAPAAITIPLRITNQGFNPLTVDIDPASLPAWMNKTMSRLKGQVVGSDAAYFPLFGTLAAAGKYTATIKIRTNDPKTPTPSYPVTITVGTLAQTPQVAFVESDPSASGGTVRPRGPITFSAWELSGRTGMDARIHIEQTRPNEAVIVAEGPMGAGATPGQYTYAWTPPAGAGGKSYAAEVTMTDTATGLKDANGSNRTGWDLEFKIAATGNRPPVFTQPTTTSTIVMNVNTGQEAVISYAVSDPDGDPLTLNLGKSIEFASSNNLQVKWDTAARQIRFTPNFGGNYTLTLAAMDPSGAQTVRQWTVSATSTAATGHAQVSNADNTIMTGSSQQLSAYLRNLGGGVSDKGCRFDWRLQGAAAWNKSALVAWHTLGGDLSYYYADLNWNVSALTTGATYEIRYIDVNAKGVDDPSPIVLHFIKAANGGKVTKIEAPATVAAGLPFTFRVFVQNTSSYTWTQAGGYKLTSGAAADPFTHATTLELGPLEMVPPSTTAVYQAWATAPAAAGSYVTRWQPYTDALKAYGTAGQATIQVASVPAVDTGELRDYLLGKWVPSAAWLTTADLDKDGKITIADLQQLANLLRSLK